MEVCPYYFKYSLGTIAHLFHRRVFPANAKCYIFSWHDFVMPLWGFPLHTVARNKQVLARGRGLNGINGILFLLQEIINYGSSG